MGKSLSINPQDIREEIRQKEIKTKAQHALNKRKEAEAKSPFSVGVCADKKSREASKREIEYFANEVLRARRKEYITSPMALEDYKAVCLSEDEMNRLKEILTGINYEAFPYSVKNIIIEGLKHPQQEVRALVKKFCKSEFKREDSPIVCLDLWIDLLSREFVSDSGWELLRDNAPVLRQYSNILYRYIKAVKDRNHNEESEALYAQTLEAYK